MPSTYEYSVFRIDYLNGIPAIPLQIPHSTYGSEDAFLSAAFDCFFVLPSHTDAQASSISLSIVCCDDNFPLTDSLRKKLDNAHSIDYIPEDEIMSINTLCNNEALFSRFEKHKKANNIGICQKQSILYDSTHFLGIFYPDNKTKETPIDWIKDVIRFQIIGPLFSHLGQKDNNVFNLLVGLEYDGNQYTHNPPNLLDTFTKCSTTLYTNQCILHIPKHFRFVIVVPYSMFSSICQAVQTHRLPFVDCVLQLQESPVFPKIAEKIVTESRHLGISVDEGLIYVLQTAKEKDNISSHNQDNEHTEEIDPTKTHVDR